MRRVIDIKKANKIEKGVFIMVPHGGMGILLAREVTKTKEVDRGKYIEITTEDGLMHLIGKNDRVVVVF